MEGMIPIDEMKEIILGNFGISAGERFLSKMMLVDEK